MLSADLFEQPKDQEQIWKEQLDETRRKFQLRVEEAVRVRAAARRKVIYQRWRQEFGDDIARESARFVETYLKGNVKWPSWFC